MTKKKDWTPYKAALRRKKIAQEKRLKADQYIDEMNKRANGRTLQDDDTPVSS